MNLRFGLSLSLRSQFQSRDDQGAQEQERRAKSAREGKRRILRAREAAAAARGHHESAGQGLRDQAHHQLPQDATGLSRRSDQ